LTPAEGARIAELGVAPLATTHRLPAIHCPLPAHTVARIPCTRPAAVDVMWRPLDDVSRASAALLAAGSLPIGMFESSTPAPGTGSTDTPAYPGGMTADQPAVPLAILDAIARDPLSEGDGALLISSTPSALVAVGTGVVDPAAPTQACAVARLRAQRELTRFVAGSRLESRIGLSTAESRGTAVEEHFHEDIAETTAGRIAGAAIAAQWTVTVPLRCRVALWIPDGPTARHDRGDLPPH
jgi:hypothetical protein